MAYVEPVVTEKRIHTGTQLRGKWVMMLWDRARGGKSTCFHKKWKECVYMCVRLGVMERGMERASTSEREGVREEDTMNGREKE